ncbi:four-helix bundle copper-binding protein [Halorientalis brevis]|uniref:Four-helix bundle copper-binding protein n=1 Tax=Halorientalis brevis TaxID=1126241 RepID=A0ABD6CDE7_9EURY|nr:four-helix bundle copper-binding protein [Halorientalis brevis]
MSDQYPQQGGQQTQWTGQQGTTMGQSGMTGQQGGLRLQDVQSPQEAAAMNAITRAIEICEWCADQCVAEGNANMAECIRLCEDVSEIGEASQVLLSRKSNYSTPILQTLNQAMQACAQECSRHNQGHCQDCASVLGQSLNAIQQLTGSKRQGMQQGGMTQGRMQSGSQTGY